MSFIKINLKEIKYPTERQSKKEGWDVEGILHKYSNQILKFDIRNMVKLNNDYIGKEISKFSKADKIVFEFKNVWVIIDRKELIQYLKNKKIKNINIKHLINNLMCSIVINKYESKS